MITETIRMSTDQQTLIPLRDVLALFEPNNWRWTVEAFDGFGRFPADITWAEFLDIVNAEAAVFDWNGILRFADGVVQMIDGRIVATDENGARVVKIDALDSTEYEVVIDPAWSDVSAFVSRVAAAQW
ncbi:hypothetical protein [Nocardia sp. NPDC050710]|uniref:hypothetical protein n=1 Tax=Nocardia sp. NPDC050710 TaxID=3157220 RepID=UPI00340B77A7